MIISLLHMASWNIKPARPSEGLACQVGGLKQVGEYQSSSFPGGGVKDDHSCNWWGKGNL